MNEPLNDGRQNDTAGQTRLLGEHSEREPPDPIPNSEVKPLCADDSVAGCHVKVGHRQALKTNALSHLRWGFFLPIYFYSKLLCNKYFAQRICCMGFSIETWDEILEYSYYASVSRFLNPK